MTKGGGFAFGPGGYDIANFHLRVVDDDAINEQFDQLSALGKRQLVQRGQRALAKRLDSLGSGCYVDVLLCLGIELAQLLPETLLALSHLLSFTLELLTLDALG
jgi:hypothetical protein